jgi:DNA repair exonuclease SbcCD ATPase subunit
MCTKRAGTCLCAGCKAHFCRKHFNDHHEQLLKELDGYVEERNTLQDQINKADPHNAILLQIDEWKKTMIEKVTQVAEQARNQVTVPSTKRADIATKLKELSDKLSYLKETEDFVEDDLKQLKEMTDKLRQDIEKATELPSLELHIDESEQINWNRLIYVKEKPATTENEQNQQQTTGELINKFICLDIYIFIFNHEKILYF